MRMATIAVPNPLPSATEDAENLKKAVHGWGTDEKAIIEILCRRTASQRFQIANAYSKLYNESLIDRLHAELSGDFRNAVVLWATNPAERDAKLSNKALKNKGDRYTWVLIEVACASTPDHLMAVRQAYCSLFSSSLEEDIAFSSAFKEPLKELLVRLVTSYRYTDEYVDQVLAKFESVELYNAIKKKQPHHEDVIRIISTRNKSQLKATFQHYKQDHGKAIDELALPEHLVSTICVDAVSTLDKIGKDIKHHGSSQFSEMLKAAVLCLASPEKHFAEVIRSSIVGLGTDESSLTRAIVCRAEIDMKKIKAEYKIRYKMTVTRDVTGDTSGYYKDILLTLVGGEDP